jgi:cytochrome c-type biogenesis protein CcmH
VTLLVRSTALGGAPLVELQTEARHLPLPFVLSDDLAVSPEDPLSRHEAVTLIARVSLAGEAEPRPGDLEGEVQAVTVGSQGVDLVIDRVRP